MTKEQAIQEVNNAFEPAFANYIITALTEGSTPYDKCEDTVSREAAQEAVENIMGKYIPMLVGRYQEMPLELAVAIKELPSVAPARKKGKWIKGVTKEKYDYFGDRVRVADYECSICGRVIPDIAVDGGFANELKDYPYCHCGAEMEVER